MLRILFKVVMVVVVLFAIFSYIAYLKTGRFYIPNFQSSAINLSMPSFGQSSKMESLSPPAKDKLFKWRENGAWVYGDKPPENVQAQPVY